MARRFIQFLKGFGREPAPEVAEPERVPAFAEESTEPIPTRPELIFTPYLAASDVAVSFADPTLPDMPLIHTNDAFCALTGYAREECIGRNCRFLQGELTRPSEVDTLRTGIATERFVLTRLLNYRRDGRLFDNILQLGQLRDTRGDVRFLFGIQWDVTETLRRLDESVEVDLKDRTLTPQLRMLERLSRHLVRRSIELGEGAAGVPLVERIVVMSRPYQFPIPDARPDRAALHALLAYLLEPYGYGPGANLKLDGAPGSFASELAGPLALWLHELVNVSAQTGIAAEEGGTATLSWGFPTERGKPMIAFHWNKSVVEGMPGVQRFRPFAPANLVGGNGARIMREIVEFAGGRSVVQAWEGGIDATLLLPNESIG